MFKMPNTDELDKYLFKSLAKELYPEASLVDLVRVYLHTVEPVKPELDQTDKNFKI